MSLSELYVENMNVQKMNKIFLSNINNVITIKGVSFDPPT